MKEHIEDILVGGRPMTDLELKDKEIERLNKNKNDVIEFIERYLKLDLDNFDTEGLLTKILEIIERGDYIDSD